MIHSTNQISTVYEREVMLTDIQAIVLAAGKSTRFNTGNTKLIEKVCGQEILLYPLSVLQELSIPTTLVVGFQKVKIKSAVEKKYPDTITYLEQEEINGTAGALRVLQSHFQSSHILVMKADVPLINTEIIESLYAQHTATGAAVSFVTAHNGDPTGFTYSRVVKKGAQVTVRKAHELSHTEMQDLCCVNAGIYIFTRSFLEKELQKITRNESTGEFHVSDLINVATDQGYTVTTTTVPFDHIRGVNTHQELWAMEQIKRSELIKYWMDRGVRFSSAHTVQIDLDVTIGAGTTIECGVHLLSGTKIGTDCTVSPFTILEKSDVGNNTTVHPHSIIRNASIGANSEIGPFAHVQQESTIGDNCAIGNFVETKRVTIGNNSKAKHLSYLGDAIIGSNVNIGAGAITCNYDGKKKHTTSIKDNVFIGTNTSLVAPVTIEQNAFTAAGSVITQDVPEHTLAIGRARQVNKEQYQNNTAPQKEIDSSKESLSFIGAYKTHNDSSTTDQ